MAPWVHWLLAGATLALLLPHTACQTCLVGLDILESNSSLAFGGAVTQPITSTISLARPDTTVGLSGRLFLQLPGACPATAQGALAALEGAAFLTPANASALQLYPLQLQAQVGSLAQLTVSDVALDAASSPLRTATAPAGSSNGTVSAGATLSASLVSGTTATTVALTPAPVTADLAGLNASTPVAPKFSAQGNTLTLQLPVNFSFVSAINTLGVAGEAVYFIAGNLTAEAVLGCQPDCGVHGRCRSSANSTLACECECGWAGAACDVASGFCPRFASASAGACPARNVTAAAAPAANCSALLGANSSSLCDARRQFNASSGACDTCSAGWAGTQCDVCQNDGVCRAYLDDPAANCSNSYTYSNYTRLKSYSCRLGGGLDVLIDPTTFRFACNTSSAAPAATSAALDRVTRAAQDSVTSTAPATTAQPPFCELRLSLVGSLAQPIVCTATGCDFAPGSSRVACNSTMCTCPSGCPSGANGILNTVAGKPTTFDCTAAGACTVDIQDFFVQITANCSAGDCQSDSVASTLSAGGRITAASSTSDYKALIAAIPVLVLVAVALMCITYMTTTLAFWHGLRGGKRAQRPGALAAIAAPGAGAAALDAKLHQGGAHSARFQVLRFESLSCSIPLGRYGGTPISTSPVLARFTSAWEAVTGLGAPGKAAGAQAGAGGSGGAQRAAGGALYARTTTEDERDAPLLVAPAPQPAGVEMQPSSAGAGAPLPASPRRWQLGDGKAWAPVEPGAQAASATPPAPAGMHPAAGQLAPAAASAAPPGARDFADVRADTADGRMTILRSVSGEARMGQLVGLLGPSGSGKTTLLSILAGSAADMSRASLVSGSITVDGAPLKPSVRKLFAYVPQDDFLLPTLTVEECLRYSALLRLPHSLPAAAIQARVDAALDELGLRGVARAQVGGSAGIRGISGGERRRVTIGMELVINPAVIILDEPTSGLDSFTALTLMGTLKAVAAAGRIVLLSFHQPSPAMFDMLDTAMLMAAGRCVYAGPPAGAGDFFGDVGLPLPPQVPTAEHMLNIVSHPEQRAQLLQAVGTHAHELRWFPSSSLLRPAESHGNLDGTANGNGAADSSAASIHDSAYLHLAGKGEGDLEAQGGGAGSSDSDAPGDEGVAEGPAAAAAAAPRRAPVRRELAVLFWRALVDIWRNRALLRLHVLVSAVMGLLVGCLFYQVSNDIAGAQNRAGGIFFSLCFLAFASLTTVDLLLNERRLVVREVRGGYYRPASYLLAKGVMDGLLLRVLPALLYGLPFYYLVGLQRDSAKVGFFFMMLATFSAAVGVLSMAVSVASNSAGKANLVMNLVLLLSLLFGGFLVNITSIPSALRWAHWLSVFFYAFEALIVNEMTGIFLDFQVSGYSAVRGVRGEVFLNALGIRQGHVGEDAAVLAAAWAGLFLAAAGLLYASLPRAAVVHKVPLNSSPTMVARHLNRSQKQLSNRQRPAPAASAAGA